MKYDKIEGTEDTDSNHDSAEAFLDEKITPTPRPQHFGRLSWILIIEHILIIFFGFALWKIFVPTRTNLNYQVLTEDKKIYPSGPLSWSQHFETLPCGKTPEEARARGCEFDMLVTAWLPPRCIDRDLTQEFMDLGKWQFYTKLHGGEEDKFGTYDPDFMGSVNHTIWTTRSWHTTHCLFMFKKMGRALVNGWTVDAEAVSMPHTEHCMKTFIDQVLFGPYLDPDEINTYLEIIYPPC
jgi:hypothetical protein